MDEMHKFGAIVVPISWLVGGIVALILGLIGPYRWWFSYLLGLFTALLNFGLMMKSNRKLENKAKENIEAIRPKKMALTGYGIRILIFVAVFGAVTYNQFRTPEPRLFCIPMVLGYLTLKLIIILYGIIRHGKVNA